MQKKATALLIVNGFIVTFVAIAFGLMVINGPWLEASIFGYVIEVPKPTSLFRGYIVKQESGREVEVGCFDFDPLRKLADAKPYKEAFTIQTIGRMVVPGARVEMVKYSDSIPVSVYTEDPSTHQQVHNFKTHKAGETWERGYCFEMPGTIADTQHIVVSGSLQHSRLIFGEPNPLWHSVAPVPTFELLPTRCYTIDWATARGLDECKPSLTSSP